MISREDFTYLSSPEAREMIAIYKGQDAIKLALKGVPRAICSVVGALERCKKKLPDHYRVSAIVDDLAYEQSSSAATASTKSYSGSSCLDLTLGLGVDSYHLSRSFDNVISLERNDLYAQIGRYNMSLLGADNITIINCSAEEYLTECKESFDMVYVDPARRDESRRTPLLEDCSPNILELSEQIFAITDRLVIKASPLFDADMAERIFSKWGSVTITAVSLSGECKELLIEVNRKESRASIGRAEVILSSGQAIERQWEYHTKRELAVIDDITTANYLYIPDVALYKMRRLDMACQEPCQVSCHEGVLLSEQQHEVVGLGFKIVSIHSYTPKKLKSTLKREGKQRATIYRKGCRATGEEIRRSLGIKDGNSAHFVFTSYRDSDIIIEVTTLK